MQQKEKWKKENRKAKSDQSQPDRGNLTIEEKIALVSEVGPGKHIKQGNNSLMEYL